MFKNVINMLAVVYVTRVKMQTPELQSFIGFVFRFAMLFAWIVFMHNAPYGYRHSCLVPPCLGVRLTFSPELSIKELAILVNELAISVNRAI